MVFGIQDLKFAILYFTQKCILIWIFDNLKDRYASVQRSYFKSQC